MYIIHTFTELLQLDELKRLPTSLCPLFFLLFCPVFEASLLVQFILIQVVCMYMQNIERRISLLKKTQFHFPEHQNEGVEVTNISKKISNTFC